MWKVGDVILDLYKVTALLGEGGFDKVYKVRHQVLNVDLAVKIPKPEKVALAGGIEEFSSAIENLQKQQDYIKYKAIQQITSK